MKNKHKIVLIQGTFDIVHWGHCKVFELCKTFGDTLIVALNTNKLVRSYKHREPIMPYVHKKFLLENLKWIDLVIPAPHFSPLELLKKYNVDVFCIGEEWRNTKSAEIEYIKSKGGEVRFIPSPIVRGVIRTSDIKRTLLKEAQEGDMG